ncbi:metallophosphoesterase family protein [Candidatus Viridilinea mediisalina]|uniref:Metallophosphoesterase n=1 Tax=Candidatus Viridilinea mediisalina TaxID=2024553 RepID=A0A2A6RFS0_9CHLR|nr:metallophosphoesterase family protein [Candidatus Viridilinea mediisalina]PDW01725.1 metallophosphoesterase [Candidatus Viridilinea mediisalina]
MRILLVSDIHSNIVALEAVLLDAGSFDQLWCLGDTIGYGPSPNECVDLMRHHAKFAISGNHDMACLGQIDLRDFNPDARNANLWNGEQLTATNHDWLANLAPRIDVDERYLLAHGSPREPVWEYLLSAEAAAANFEVFSQKICFVGHSHVQLGFRQRNVYDRVERFLPDMRHQPPREHVIDLSGGCRFFINPGSVGQPRDQDKRAAYALLDSDAATLTFMRVEYEIERTQKQMVEHGLPTALIRRLEYGM